MKALEFRTATADEIAPMVDLLDHAFMWARNRTGSVAAHYPDIFQPANSCNLLVLGRDGTPVSFCAVQEFTLHTSDAIVRGGMIGFVYTSPEHRGEGLAHRLLKETELHLKNRGVDFAVLFTTLTAFYQSQGWTSRDAGLCGAVAGKAPAPVETEPVPVDVVPPAPDLVAQAEVVRQRTEKLWVERPAFVYNRRPLAARQVSIVLSPSREGYALIGIDGPRAYLYEFSGSEPDLAAIWAELVQTYHEIFVNTHASANALPWLRRQEGVALHGQRHALWKWLAPGAAAPSLTLDHIPYFDRI